MTDHNIEVSTHRSISQIGEVEWDRCACPEAADGAGPLDPFTSYRFLNALEASGSVGSETGWLPYHLRIVADGEVIGVAPLYLKSHSQGEYIFDHAWAQAFENAGGRYYPKLQLAVPFTPVTGRRVLARAGHETTALRAVLEALARLSAENGLSSAHITFCTASEARAAEATGFVARR